MNDTEGQLKFLCDQLISNGSCLSAVEIEEIVNTLKDVSLKLIVTNVPREVYHAKPAQDAFENLFKAFDAQSSFLYLPSFNRAQVFMAKPEAALCARLQCQGWKLPKSVLDELPPDSVRSENHSGINCFVDQLDEESDQEDSVDAECTCGLLFNDDDENDDPDESRLPGIKTNKPASVTDSMKTSSSDPAQLVDHTHPTPPPVTVQTVSSIESIGDQPSHSLDRSIVTSECDNTSEASGDDLASPSLCSRPSPPKLVCKKHGTTQGRRKMKLLAPPKPSRQFLLSPPTSPPVGWEPKPEAEPVINYDLLAALAALAPGEAFELHPVNTELAHPSIVITPCEPQSSSVRPPIVQTKCPERRV